LGCGRTPPSKVPCKGDGRAQNYIDNAIIQETTYQTSNVTSEVAAGGVYTNMIPKDGGNQFHGDLFLAG
jgi:hypothetical protein